VAAELQKESGVEVELRRGGLGELRVEVDGIEVYRTNPLWYPPVGSVLKKVRGSLRS
jgi:hypothetical protein